MISKFYKKNIAEGKNLLIFSILFSIIIRAAYLLHPDIKIELVEDEGYLWMAIAPFLSNKIVSIIVSVFFLFIIVFLVNYINTEYAFIRRRTLLPCALIILLSSCMPSQVLMSPYYLASLSILLVINSLFKGYGASYKQTVSIEASFHLAIGSLFAPALLIYFPLVWISLVRMKNFSFRAFLASLFSIFLVYFPVFTYFLLVDDIATFTRPFVSLSSINWGDMPLLSYRLENYLVLGIGLLLTLIVLIDNSMNSFKDKIRVRIFLFVLTLFSLFSFVCLLFLNLSPMLTLTILLTVASLHIAHFFSLAEQRIMSALFFIYLLFLIAISVIPFMNL